jgi:hypothetical protein
VESQRASLEMMMMMLHLVPSEAGVRGFLACLLCQCFFSRLAGWLAGWACTRGEGEFPSWVYYIRPKEVHGYTHVISCAHIHRSGGHKLRLRTLHAPSLCPRSSFLPTWSPANDMVRSCRLELLPRRRRQEGIGEWAVSSSQP